MLDNIEFEGSAKGGSTGGRMSQRARMGTLAPRSAAQVSALPRANRSRYHAARSAGVGHKAALAKATKKIRTVRKPTNITVGVTPARRRTGTLPRTGATIAKKARR